MDPLTHMTLGASVAMALAGREHRRAAGLGGLVAGLLPDADVFIRSVSDPLLAIEYHRHFTHSWVFQPVTALVAFVVAVGLRRIVLGPARVRVPFWPVLAAALSHPFCDLWTSYGTRVHWPFSQAREALDWVSVIDPMVTIPLFIGVIVAFCRPKGRATLVGLLWVALYLSCAAMQKGRATDHLHAYLQAEGIVPERISVRPSFANIVVWRGVWQEGETIACASIRAGREVELKPGQTAKLVRVGDVALGGKPVISGTVLHGDVQRFAHFSDGWLIWHPTVQGVIGDARYSMLPDSLDPLWGIGLEAKRPEEHASWETFRSDSRQRLAQLWSLVLGR